MNKGRITHLDLIEAHGNMSVVRADLEWAGSCPRCGGDDRFHVFAPERCKSGSPDGWAWCRKECGTSANPFLWVKFIETGRWQDWEGFRTEFHLVEPPEVQFTPAQLEIVEDIRSGRASIPFSDQLAKSDFGKGLWRERHVGDVWQGVWGLGYTNGYPMKDNSRWDALVLPWTGPDGIASTQQFRLWAEQGKKIPGGKYRFRKGIQPRHPHFAILDKEMAMTAETLIVVEGGIKAASLTAQLIERGISPMSKSWQVCGVPSAESAPSVWRTIRGYKNIILMMDPDCHIPANGKPSIVGRIIPNLPVDKVRICQLPAKPDDLFDMGYTADRFLEAVRYSRAASSWAH